jgi:ankyrin repeat protein/predicted DCC family thiol-disulfide oxidoreductase YuxK
MTEKLWVIYDGHCGFCVACRRWLEAQPALVPLEFLPLSSPEVRRLFPRLAIPENVDEPIVISDQGAVYRGSSAWILCLWALEDYRELAARLASPALLPFARRIFETVSRNRTGLSNALGLRSEASLPVAAGTPSSEIEPARGVRAWQILLAACILWMLFLALAGHRQGLLTWMTSRGYIRSAATVRTLGASPEQMLLGAADKGRLDVVRVLLDTGARPDPEGTSGKTPLMQATASGQTKIARTLLAHGADPNRADSDGTTAVDRAALSEKKELLASLLAAGGKLDHIRFDGDTPLAHEAAFGHVENVRALIAAGANVHALSRDGSSVLLKASEHGRKVEAVRALLAAGADPNVPDARGQTPLMSSASFGLADIACELLARGADFEAQDHEGRTAMILTESTSPPRSPSIPTSRRSSRSEEIRQREREIDSPSPPSVEPVSSWENLVLPLLLERGATTEARDNRGQTVLSHAARNGHASSVKTLLAAGANAEAENAAGWTPLALAVRSGDAETVRLLLAAGADPRRRFSSGKAIWGIAFESRHTEIQRLLEAAGDRE